MQQMPKAPQPPFPLIVWPKTWICQLAHSATVGDGNPQWRRLTGYENGESNPTGSIPYPYVKDF